MSLDAIMLKYPTDKSSAHHNYCHIYESYFAPLKNQPITLLELGVGGYHFEDRGGGDLQGFAEYFPKAFIHAVDIHPKKIKGRFITHVGSQADEGFLNGLIDQIGAPDIIIDDASHINPLTIRSFEILFPKLKRGGIYIIEDCHTSYWKDIATDGTDFKGGDHPGTVMNHFKAMADRVNLEEIDVKGIHFYKQLIVILKK